MNYIEHLFINFKYQKKNFPKFYFELKKEIKNLKENHLLQIKTIYIATNDFLLLTDQELISLLSLLQQFTSDHLIEYSLEISYQTLVQNHLAILKQFQVNRLVWKVRTFNKNLLANLNQKYDSSAMINLIKTSSKLGYTNFSIDLENNLIKQSKADILNDLKIAVNLKSPHISYQSSTNSHNCQSRKIIDEFLKQNNYQNYEFFSFAVSKKYYSQQTLAYLTLKNWYGLGPNAGSFLKLGDKFITINNSDRIPWKGKIITLKTNEYYQLLLTQNLMLVQGVDLRENSMLTKQINWPQIISLVDRNYLEIKNNYLKVTNQNWNLLNQILIDIISSN